MNEQQFIKLAKKSLKYVLLGGVALSLVAGSIFTTNEGFTYVVQDTALGSSRIYTEPGVHLKVPFVTIITEYKQVATINFGSEDPGDFTRSGEAIPVTFADTYSGSIPTTFRFRLPRSPEKIIEMHKEFRSYNNLVDALLVKNARNVVVVTATQYTGEEFFQGGINSYKVKLEDQLREGLYETNRQQVEVQETNVATVSANQESANELQTTNQLVWKQVVTMDSTGQPVRLSNPLDEYGIDTRQVTIGRPVPEDRLDSLLTKKKELVAQRISAEQEIITNKAKARAKQQQVEIERVQAVQLARKDQEVAVIAEQRETKVEEQRALRELVQKAKEKDVAVIQKQKELEVAKANRDIQEANAEAAKFEALAIKEKGLAQVAVSQADLQAKQSSAEIYLAELSREVATVMYSNLSKFTVTMPQNYVNQGDSGGQSMMSNLDVLTAFGAMNLMKQTSKQSSE